MVHRTRPSLTTVLGTLLALTAALAAMACGSEATAGVGPTDGGTLLVQLTDAPFALDSLKSVDLYVVRIDGKQAEADSADADSHTDDANDDHGGWTTLAEPKAKIDLLALRDGKVANLGQKTLTAGAWRSFRLILDSKQSSVTLKDGTVLTSTSNPGVKFPSADRSGIKIQLDKPVTLGKDSTKTLVVDFDLSKSFVMRGPQMKNGLLLKPEIKGSTK